MKKHLQHDTHTHTHTCCLLLWYKYTRLCVCVCVCVFGPTACCNTIIPPVCLVWTTTDAAASTVWLRIRRLKASELWITPSIFSPLSLPTNENTVPLLENCDPTRPERSVRRWVSIWCQAAGCRAEEEQLTSPQTDRGSVHQNIFILWITQSEHEGRPGGSVGRRQNHHAGFRPGSVHTATCVWRVHSY